MAKTKNSKGKMSHGAANSRRFPLSSEMLELIQKHRSKRKERATTK